MDAPVQRFIADIRLHRERRRGSGGKGRRRRRRRRLQRRAGGRPRRLRFRISCKQWDDEQAKDRENGSFHSLILSFGAPEVNAGEMGGIQRPDSGRGHPALSIYRLIRTLEFPVTYRISAVQTAIEKESLKEAFERFVSGTSFPCMGAKSALARGRVTLCLADDIGAGGSDEKITRELQDFARALEPGSLFVSFAVLFRCRRPLSEEEYERHLWSRLEAMHVIDRADYRWDPQVSSDPESAEFSMSIGGRAFYVVGLHPGASRAARRFENPAIIFNPHSQFEQLRESGCYERLREAILERDERVNGSVNPMLAQHGESPEARQYSGRMVDEAWRCPFRPDAGDHA